MRTGPPPMRQLTSIRRGPCDVYLSSTWNTPIVKPSACTDRTPRSISSRCWWAGRMEGQLEPVSLKYGSTVGQLSVMAPYTGAPSLSTRSTSTSGPSRYSSSMRVVLIQVDAAGRSSGPPPSSSAGPCCSAPATMRAAPISFCTRLYVASSSASELTRTTPMDAAPKMGLMTAGKPTLAAAAPSWPSSVMRNERGLGRPAASMTALVLDLSRASSTAEGGLPGRPSFSARRATRGTAISQNVHTPSTSPTSRFTLSTASSARSNTVSASAKSRGTKRSTVPSAARACTHESGPSSTTERTPSSLARSNMKRLPE